MCLDDTVTNLRDTTLNSTIRTRHGSESEAQPSLGRLEQVEDPPATLEVGPLSVATKRWALGMIAARELAAALPLRATRDSTRGPTLDRHVRRLGPPVPDLSSLVTPLLELPNRLSTGGKRPRSVLGRSPSTDKENA